MAETGRSVGDVTTTYRQPHCPHSPPSFVIITHLESWYSFDRPIKDRRLSVMSDLAAAWRRVRVRAGRLRTSWSVEPLTRSVTTFSSVRTTSATTDRKWRQTTTSGWARTRLEVTCCVGAAPTPSAAIYWRSPPTRTRKTRRPGADILCGRPPTAAQP